MKLVPWLLTGSLILVGHSLVSEIRAVQQASELQREETDIRAEPATRLSPVPDRAADRLPPMEQRPVAANRQTGGGSCESAGVAVVTIHAGRSFGSGSIVSADGLVITNNHVVRPARDRQVGVKTQAGKRYEGMVTAIDPVNDLALIKLNTSDRLPTMPIGDPATVQMGQAVCAIGSPYGRAGVLTKGTLTFVRGNGDLQSALLLEPGNSGGPLLNQQGQMIGINKAIWKSRNGENSGISFATNMTIAQNFIAQNRLGNQYAATPEIGSATASESSAPLLPRRDRARFAPPNSFSVPSQPFYGGENSSGSLPSRLPAPSTGARLGMVIGRQTLQVESVEPGSAGAVAGFQVGDRLIALDGTQIQGVEQIQTFLGTRPEAVIFTIERNQQRFTIQVNF